MGEKNKINPNPDYCLLEVECSLNGCCAHCVFNKDYLDAISEMSKE